MNGSEYGARSDDYGCEEYGHLSDDCHKAQDITAIGQQIVDYEEGRMGDESIVPFFQALVDSGLAWKLQGHYGRTAARLIEAGEVESNRNP